MIPKKSSLLLGTALLVFCAAPRPGNLGLTAGKFFPCPRTPNCVNTQSADSAHAMQPLHYKGSRDSAMARLVRVISSMKRTKIITLTPAYLHVEFTTALMRYVDDVEFFVDDSKKTIEFRSASRIGYSDMGVNRKRMGEITARFLSDKEPH